MSGCSLLAFDGRKFVKSLRWAKVGSQSRATLLEVADKVMQTYRPGRLPDLFTNSID